MKKETQRMLGVITIVVAGAAVMAGCGQKADTQSTEPGVVEQTKDAAVKAGEATKDAAGRGMEKTGEAIENAGDAMQKTGDEMQC